MGIKGKLLVSRKNIVVSKDSIGIDKDLTKDRNLNTFKMYCKRRKSSARFPDRKARNPLYACHCIAGNAEEREAVHVEETREVEPSAAHSQSNWQSSEVGAPAEEPVLRRSSRTTQKPSRLLYLPLSLTQGFLL